MPNFCYWSIGTSNGNHLLLKEAVATARTVGIKEPIHAWTNEVIQDCDVHRYDLTQMKWNEFFIITFLRQMYKLFKYDYYIFIHADTVFRHSLPSSPLDLLHKSPIHLFLDSPMAQSKEEPWDQIPFSFVEEKMRDLRIATREIYTADTGFWIIHRDAIPMLSNLIQMFHQKINWAGYKLTNTKMALVYAMHLLCADTSLHMQEKNADFWAADRMAFFETVLPTDGLMKFSYANGNQAFINPAILHAKKSRFSIMEKHKEFIPQGLEELNM
jgi:hypothetical protein